MFYSWPRASFRVSGVLFGMVADRLDTSTKVSYAKQEGFLIIGETSFSLSVRAENDLLVFPHEKIPFVEVNHGQIVKLSEKKSQVDQTFPLTSLSFRSIFFGNPSFITVKFSGDQEAGEWAKRKKKVFLGKTPPQDLIDERPKRTRSAFMMKNSSRRSLCVTSSLLLLLGSFGHVTSDAKVAQFKTPFSEDEEKGRFFCGLPFFGALLYIVWRPKET